MKNEKKMAKYRYNSNCKVTKAYHELLYDNNFKISNRVYIFVKYIKCQNWYRKKIENLSRTLPAKEIQVMIRVHLILNEKSQTIWFLLMSS